MISGRIIENFPHIRLAVTSSSHSEKVDFLVDTGFDGELAIPKVVALRLGLRPDSFGRSITLADGKECRCEASEVLVSWGEEEQLSEVLLLDGRPLLGVQMLQEHSLYAEFADGGEVTIEPI